MGLRAELDGPLAERGARLRRDVEVALYTPRRFDGRPLSIAAVPAGLGGLPAHDRTEAARFAASALAGMMNYGDGKRDQSCLAILGRAIDLLCQENPQAPVSIEELIRFIDEKDSSLINEVGRLDVKLFDRLVQDLETLRLNQGDLLAARGEPLDVEALLGLGRHAVSGKTRLSIISTKFLGSNQDVQFWVAQFLMEVGRWISRSPPPTACSRPSSCSTRPIFTCPPSSSPRARSRWSTCCTRPVGRTGAASGHPEPWRFRLQVP